MVGVRLPGIQQDATRMLVVDEGDIYKHPIGIGQPRKRSKTRCASRAIEGV